MSRRPGAEPPSKQDEMREAGLSVATRLVALLRTGRSYAIGNAAFTRQLDQLVAVLAPVFATDGHAEVLEYEDDLYLNGERLPLRTTNLRSLEQLQQELRLRSIAGVQFTAGLDVAELESFMRFFLASEMYKGDELLQACLTEGLAHALPVLQVEAIDTAEVPPPVTATSESWARARGACTQALANVRLLMPQGLPQAGIEVRHMKRALHPLIDAACAGEPINAALVSVQTEAPTAVTHALHVALVAIAIGRVLGFDRRALAELGVAALLHDVGHLANGAAVSRPPAEWSDADREAVRRHPLEGVRHLARTTPLDASTLAALRAALEHHTLGPRGYPDPTGGSRPGTISRTVAIADAFVSILTPVPGAEARLGPSEALGTVLGPLADRFGPALRGALIRAVGIHPPGQIVQLKSGQFARTHGTEPSSPERPLLEMLSATGAATPELLTDSDPIERALPFEQWPTAA